MSDTVEDTDTGGDEVHPNLVVIGPSMAGKTALLATLTYHSNLSTGPYGDEYSFSSANEESERLAEEIFLALERAGAFTPTQPKQDSLISVKMEGPPRPARFFGLLPRQAENLTFDFLDMAGGDLFPARTSTFNSDPEHSVRRKKIEDIILKAKYILVCISCDEENIDAQTVQRYCHILTKIRTESKIVERVAVCMTKYESRLSDLGRNAAIAAQDYETIRSIANSTIDGAIAKELKRLSQRPSQLGRARSERVEVRLAPVSAFGFVRGNGCPNSVKLQNGDSRLLTSPPMNNSTKQNEEPEFHAYEASELQKLWAPYRVADPFIWLATGIAPEDVDSAWPMPRIDELDQPAP